MPLSKKLRDTIEQDIIKCESFSERKGSEMLFDQLVSKYINLDLDFKKDLQKKVNVIGFDYDYRPELKNIAAKLSMWLLLDSDLEKQHFGNLVSEFSHYPRIFISHRSKDKEIADMILDFLIGTGISRDHVFCSSLPGNDIKEKISVEVKDALKNSVVNILVLSNDYYQSAYCLNEAGIMWFFDTTPVIPVALPEITSENMYGFLSNEYKIRRLDCGDDISYIYDTVRTAISTHQCKASIITTESTKLKMRYQNYLAERAVYLAPKTSFELEISSNDEAIVLYYILTKKVRKLKKSDVKVWMINEELYDVNIDNAFDLLSSSGNGMYNNDVLELDIEYFRQYSIKSEDLLPRLIQSVELHRKLSRDTFKTIWQSEVFDDVRKLFISYIIDEKIFTLGDRWMAESQIKDIKKWEQKNELDNTLSSNYSSCLSVFIENHLVFECSWTSYGNPREYSLCTSLLTYLHSSDFQNKDEIEKVKQNHIIEVPF